jgi:hypothetical protein
MDSLKKLPLKKVFLQLLIASIAVSALLGILAILIGNFGEFETRVLLTTLTISAASLCGLCCGAAIEIRGQKVLPLAGIFTAIVAAILVIVGIWTEPSSEAFWKFTATAAIFAVALSHLSLLTLARLSAKYAWAMPAAYGLVFAVAFLLTGMLWGEWSGDLTARLIGVAGILDGAITILIPIFHRLSQDDRQTPGGPNLEELDREIAQLENRLQDLRARKEAAKSKKLHFV